MLTPEKLAELRRRFGAANEMYQEVGDAESLALVCDCVPELLDEIERLRGLMAESPMLSHLVAEPGGLRLEGTVPHWMAQRIAESLFETLADAENFVIVHFDSEQGPIEVTVRRPGGKPVATVQAEQLAEIARLRAELAARTV